MTTTQTPPPAPADTPKKDLKVFVLPLLTLIVVGSLLAVFMIVLTGTSQKGVESRIASMQQSLESHGITAEGDLAERVVDACRGADPGSPNGLKPLSTSIIQEHEGKKSVITLICDGDSRISDFAAIPVP